MSHLIRPWLFHRLTRHFTGSRRAARPMAKRVLPAIETLEDRTVPTAFIVNSLGDDNVGSGNVGDLRYVINRANTLRTGTAAVPDSIVFTGVTLTATNHTIRVGAGAAGAKPLPTLTAKVVLDGTTAGGFNNLTGLLLTLDGHQVRGRANGLTLQGGHATVRGLRIANFSGHGILVNSSGNTIGGDLVGFNAAGQRNTPAGRITSPLPPTQTTPVFVRPPQGNVIESNGGDGVRLENGANHNVLEGNFIGTDVTGTRASGNGGDGVAILNSHFNQVLGTLPPDKDNPFVFYNVISGNRGNGLVIDNSNSTVVYANIFGLGSNNDTPIGNHRNGVLIKGTSDQTKFGGNIPLGNVSAANGRNGVEVRDSASRTVFGNPFVGVAAFNPTPQVGNHQNGVLVTSTGGGKFLGKTRFSTILLTCQLAGNGRDGIAIGGNAAAIQVSQSVIGMQTNGRLTQSNRRNGISITGNASRITIGGFEPSVAGVQQQGSFLAAANLISGNLWNGVYVGGNARGVTIINSLIGSDTTNTGPAANGRNGILLDGASGVQIGPRRGANAPHDRNVIAFNDRDGVAVSAGTGNSILGNSIFSNRRRGIDLSAGGNENQRAPVLTSALMGSGGLTAVTGSLRGQSKTTYQIEVFANSTGDAGNGRIFLGFVKVRTNAAGKARFTLSGLSNPTLAGFLTATATGPTGNTSAFSGAILATRNG